VRHPQREKTFSGALDYERDVIGSSVITTMLIRLRTFQRRRSSDALILSGAHYRGELFGTITTSRRSDFGCAHKPNKTKKKQTTKTTQHQTNKHKQTTNNPPHPTPNKQNPNTPNKGRWRWRWFEDRRATCRAYGMVRLGAGARTPRDGFTAIALSGDDSIFEADGYAQGALRDWKCDADDIGAVAVTIQAEAQKVDRLAIIAVVSIISNVVIWSSSERDKIALLCIFGIVISSFVSRACELPMFASKVSNATTSAELLKKGAGRNPHHRYERRAKTGDGDAYRLSAHEKRVDNHFRRGDQCVLRNRTWRRFGFYRKIYDSRSRVLTAIEFCGP
jgi:hypothetical protein